jgi:hypothetical protein
VLQREWEKKERKVEYLRGSRARKRGCEGGRKGERKEGRNKGMKEGKEKGREREGDVVMLLL